MKKASRRLRESAGDDDPAGIDAALADGVDIDVRDMVGRSALHWAAGRGRVAAARHLLSLGARVKSGRASRHNTATRCHLTALQLYE
jgi:ankyrin repeat protein